MGFSYLRFYWKFLLAGLLVLIAVPAQSDYLKVAADKQRVEADIGHWTLDQLLQELSQATGWEVYVEPNSKHIVSTRFKNLPFGEAFTLMFGKLSYALLPQTNAASKLFVFQSHIQEATRRVKTPAKPKTRIRDELLVTMKPGSTNIHQLAGRLGAKITGKIDGLNAYRLKFEDGTTAQEARTLTETDPDVQESDYNYSIPRPETAEPLLSASVPPLNLKPSPPSDADPNRLVIGLIDQKVQTTGNPSDAFLLPGISVAGDSSALSGEKSPTHGTAMYQTILKSLAMLSEDGQSKARVLPVDIYGNLEQTSTFQVANGIYEAVNQGANIINLSLGGDSDSAFLHNVIKNSQSKGVLFVAAAGNEPTSSPTYPAAYSEVIAVTAGDRRGNIAYYANWGDFVDIIAPGATVVTYGNLHYMISGTSASTAYAAGVAAGMAERMQKPPAQIETELRRQLSLKPAAPGK